ncbi:hydrolase [Galbibacter sp. EGI 63066]|uniref:hydrolase n=1 Tax=Galbibacter sp. EGI 63066 TaxID=2993559 RepID=UPI002248A9B3|nr:hydrolase [Galbibacter sp. EGI 63066]MCX2681697.1 hydrolase [Galbibacter sp. EGI 63066]
MRRNIFMYLFLFAALYIIYQYVSSKKYFDSETVKMENLKEENETLKDSVQALILNNLDLQYFSLENNDDALAYYDHLELENPSRYISDKLLETNESKGNNPLVPYDGMSGAPMKINKIKVMNQKWIIADFSDGKYWGELLLRYELKDDLSVNFTLLDHLLYTRS